MQQVILARGDLRRTAATILARLGISGDVIDECLHHVIESRVRRTYIRDRRLGEQAKAFDLLGSHPIDLLGMAQRPRPPTESELAVGITDRAALRSPPEPADWRSLIG